jgi:NadR type nicotinamide-nucleotide adenylyltransferase
MAVTRSHFFDCIIFDGLYWLITYFGEKKSMSFVHPTGATINKVCVIGPECTGKTDLSKFLASHFKTECVEEYARAYLHKLGKPYTQPDLTKIAHGQLRMEQEWLISANKILICDTNLIVIKVWSEHKYGHCDPEILERMHDQKYDLYLLTNIDVPWEDDPQREHPDKREHFLEIYRKELAQTGVRVVEIAGDREARQKKAIEAVQAILN